MTWAKTWRWTCRVGEVLLLASAAIHGLVYADYARGAFCLLLLCAIRLGDLLAGLKNFSITINNPESTIIEKTVGGKAEAAE